MTKHMYTYKTSLKADKEVGGEKASVAKRRLGVSEARTHSRGKSRTLKEIIIGTKRSKH